MYEREITGTKATSRTVIGGTLCDVGRTGCGCDGSTSTVWGGFIYGAMSARWQWHAWGNCGRIHFNYRGTPLWPLLSISLYIASNRLQMKASRSAASNSSFGYAHPIGPSRGSILTSWHLVRKVSSAFGRGEGETPLEARHVSFSGAHIHLIVTYALLRERPRSHSDTTTTWG